VKGRRILVLVIACMPTAMLRGWLYGLIPGYKVDRSARIGWLSTIEVERLSLGPGSRIGPRSRLRGPMSVVLGTDAALGGRNQVECGTWYLEYDSVDAPYAREFVVGDNAMITPGHYFDAIGGVYVGEGSWIAGTGSQFWTHGLGVEDRSVVIGRYSYIGSAVRFPPGARVGDLVVVSIGSVVVGDMSGRRQALLAGVPAAVAREDYRPAGWAALEQAIADGVIAYE
jgi:carbonic anhydrase/acetyltransferase-like protein (isoleucine patch superfamily)